MVGCETFVRRRYLAEMQRHGIWYLDAVNNVYPGFPCSPCVRELLPSAKDLQRLDTRQLVDEYLTWLAQVMRKLPAFLGWYVMDERPFREVPKHFRQYCVLRAADPDHPTFGVSNRPLELRFWRDTLDVLGVDPYPLVNMKAGRLWESSLPTSFERLTTKQNGKFGKPGSWKHDYGDETAHRTNRVSNRLHHCSFGDVSPQGKGALSLAFTLFSGDYGIMGAPK